MRQKINPPQKILFIDLLFIYDLILLIWEAKKHSKTEQKACQTQAKKHPGKKCGKKRLRADSTIGQAEC